jgi:dTDP-4-amino-4,6-dideoxygalactose transaminase
MPAALKEISRLGVPILEDAAQAHGSEASWGRCGSFGLAAAFSFYPTKNLGAYGDGGMLVTSDSSFGERARRFRNYGQRENYSCEMVGYNSRLDSLQAAVLHAKLQHLSHWSAGRRANAAYYTSAFADVPEVLTPVIDPANESIFNQYTLRVDRRDALQAHLKGLGIGSAVYYPVPLHLQPCFEYLGYKQGAFPESERAAKEVLSLPIYPELTSAQLDEVITAVRAFCGR